MFLVVSQEAYDYMTIDDAIIAFLDYLALERGLSKNTIESYKNDFMELKYFIKSKKIDDNIEKFNKQMILDYYSLLEEKCFSKATLQRKYSSLNQMFKFLIKQEKIHENPMLTMRRCKKEIKLPKFLTEDEINKLLLVNNPNENEIKMRNNLIIELLYSTGMRVSELCNLPLKSVMFNDKNSNKEYKFIVIKGKGQKERIVPIRSRILPLLHSYISLTKKNKQKYLFTSHGKKDKKQNEQPITRRTIDNILKQSAIVANIDPSKVSAHKIRHSFATHLLQKGMDIREIQELLGHSSIDTTSIYTKVDYSSLKDVIKKYCPLISAYNE